MKPSAAISLVDPNRAEIHPQVAPDDLLGLTRLPANSTIQCIEPIPSEVWSPLNELVFSERPDIELRVYGHYDTDCDLNFVTRMTNVRRFAADCLHAVKNLDALSSLRGLRALSLGVSSLTDFLVLDDLPETLEALDLGSTLSNKPDLKPVGRFRSLHRLHIEGHTKGIGVLAQLQTLEEVRLRSTTTEDLSFLAKLPKLRFLDIKLGGTHNFDALRGKASIKRVELWQIRGLESIEFLQELPNLQFAFVQSLARIESIPRLPPRVKRLVFQNMRRLADFGALRGAQSLREFALIEGQKQTPEQLLPVLQNPSVRAVAAFFGSDKKNNQFSTLRDSYGKSDWSYSSPFEES